MKNRSVLGRFFEPVKKRLCRFLTMGLQSTARTRFARTLRSLRSEKSDARQRHPAKNERLVEPVPLGYMSSVFSDFMGSRLRARNLRCFFDNLEKSPRFGAIFL